MNRALTIGPLRESGLEVRAQAVYELELAGYEIRARLLRAPYRTRGLRLSATRFVADGRERLTS